MDKEERRQADKRTVNTLAKYYFTEAIGKAWEAARFMPESHTERVPSIAEIDSALHLVLRLKPKQIASAVERLKKR